MGREEERLAFRLCHGTQDIEEEHELFADSDEEPSASVSMKQKQDGLDASLEFCRSFDQAKTGYVPASKLHQFFAVLSSSMTASRVDALVGPFANEQGEVDYETLFKNLFS